MDTITNFLTQNLGALYSPEQLMVALVAAATFCIVVAGWMLYNTFNDPIRSRLVNSPNQNDFKSVELNKHAVSNEKFRSALLPSNKELQNRTIQRLNHAGFHMRRNLYQYYTLRILLMAGFTVAALIIMIFAPGRTLGLSVQGSVCALVFGYVAPSFALDYLIKKRQLALNRSIPDALDLLVVCTEAGLSFEAALQRVAKEIRFNHPILADELDVVVAETRAGLDRKQAYTNLIDRTGVEEIRGLVSAINQSIRFGVSIAETLRTYSEDFKDRRLQAAEAKAAKIGAKLVLPLAVCMLPGFILIVAVPFLLNLTKVFNFNN